MDSDQIVGWVFLALGSGVALIGVIWVMRIRRFIATATTTTGTVLTHERRRHQQDSGYTTALHPVVVFQTADGTPMQFADSTGGARPEPPVGASVPVRYDPADPTHAAIATGGRTWLGPVLIVAVGVCCMIPGVLVLALA